MKPDQASRGLYGSKSTLGLVNARLGSSREAYIYICIYIYIYIYICVPKDKNVPPNLPAPMEMLAAARGMRVCPPWEASRTRSWQVADECPAHGHLHT